MWKGYLAAARANGGGKKGHGAALGGDHGLPPLIRCWPGSPSELAQKRVLRATVAACRTEVPELEALWVLAAVAARSSGRLIAQLEYDGAGMIAAVKHNNGRSSERSRGTSQARRRTQWFYGGPVVGPSDSRRRLITSWARARAERAARAAESGGKKGGKGKGKGGKGSYADCVKGRWKIGAAEQPAA